MHNESINKHTSHFTSMLITLKYHVKLLTCYCRMHYAIKVYSTVKNYSNIILTAHKIPARKSNTVYS